MKEVAPAARKCLESRKTMQILAASTPTCCDAETKPRRTSRSTRIPLGPVPRWRAWRRGFRGLQGGALSGQGASRTAASHRETQYSHHHEQTRRGLRYGHHGDAGRVTQSRDQGGVHRCPGGGVFADRADSSGKIVLDKQI